MKTKLNNVGGIRTSRQALAYLVMVKETLGDDWMNPEMFRYGAITLVNGLLTQIAGQVDGNNQGPDYFFLQYNVWSNASKPYNSIT